MLVRRYINLTLRHNKIMEQLLTYYYIASRLPSSMLWVETSLGGVELV